MWPVIALAESGPIFYIEGTVSASGPTGQNVQIVFQTKGEKKVVAMLAKQQWSGEPDMSVKVQAPGHWLTAKEAAHNAHVGKSAMVQCNGVEVKEDTLQFTDCQLTAAEPQ